MTTLWDTTGSEVVRALTAERHGGGTVASGLVLTLVVVADETQVSAAEQAATVAASQHPCRLLLVVRRNVEATSRLDAEILVGGRLGHVEAVLMRMSGRLTLHSESVVLPLLAPDAPVVTWWFGAQPDRIAYDPLGVLADRRVTDVQHAGDALAALTQRAKDYAPGDTDLAWTRTTPWRSTVAGTYDTVTGAATAARVDGEAGSPSAALFAAWLSLRLGIDVPIHEASGAGITGVRLQIDGGEDAGGQDISVTRDGDRGGLLARTGEPDRIMPLPRGDFGDLMGEELRRLDHDPVYAEALGRVAGQKDLSARPAVRTHIWRDPQEEAAAG